MARVSTYLNFGGNAEAALNFYKTVFGTDYHGEIMRFSGMPPQEGRPALSESEINMIMHAELPILNGYVLMACDVPGSMPVKLTVGNNSYIMLEPDTKEETRKIFGLLAQGATIEQDLQEMFWGSLYGSLTDQFGVKWMFNCTEKTN